MSEAVADILSRVKDFSQSERAELAYALLLSLEPDESPEADTAFEAELTRRVAEVREGKVRGKPAEQVFAELRARRQ
jgi:putative addiction module component (TIGR02574 family)